MYCTRKVQGGLVYMEYEKIKQLIDDVGNSKLSEVEIEFSDGTKISMKKDSDKEKEMIVPQVMQEIVYKEIAETPKEVIGNIIKSPMVGTFYAKPAPDAKPFVNNGQDIKVGDTLCIIEAMKLMNEIESEYAGKVIEIYVEDGKPVEYGTPLFRIE